MPPDSGPGDQSPDDLKRQFEAAISGMELDELRALTETLLSFGRPAVLDVERPSLRRPPLPDAVTFRVRVALDHSHLHRFALGGNPFDRTSELFLCPFDVMEDEDEGAPASEVRLDETMQVPGDVLRYVYDYGDSWELTLRLEEVLPTVDTATATCVGGRRAAPPEDCGGITDAQGLAEVLDDPAHFDVDEVNQSLRDPYFVLREAGLDPRLVELANRLRFDEVGDQLAVRMMSLARPVALPSADEMAAALRPVTWFLERGSGDGLALTSAGYLKPVDVEQICAILPTMLDWFGKNNRESLAHPLQEFREWLQASGLIRKYKGRLKTTRAGAKVRDNIGALWDHLASKLIPAGKGDFEEQSALLLVAHVATSPNEEVPFEVIADMLSALGWRHGDNTPLRYYDLYRVKGGPLPLLNNVGEAPKRMSFREPVHPTAAALAHYALLRRADR